MQTDTAHTRTHVQCQSHCKNMWGDVCIDTAVSKPSWSDLTDHFTGGKLQEVSKLEN